MLSYKKKYQIVQFVDKFSKQNNLITVRIIKK